MNDVKTKKRFYGLLIAALVFLFNPNINMIDILPDFIGYFILARIFIYASDSAPYFEEARVAFNRLGWLNVAKIPAFLLIILIRRGDTLDNDVYALMSITVGALEIILTVVAIKSIFAALFHLGERTNTHSLITPYYISKKEKFAPESLRFLTYVFFTVKILGYSVPDLFLLTKTTSIGGVEYRYSGSPLYPISILFFVVVGLILGSVWLSRTKKYIKAIKAEGLFFDALYSLATEDFEYKFEIKRKLRSIHSVLTAIAVSTVFSINFKVDNFEGVDLLPDFLFGIILTVAIYKLSNHTRRDPVVIVLGSAYSLSSLFVLTKSVNFFDKYEYKDIITHALAKNAYRELLIYTVLETILCIALIVYSAFLMRAFILNCTGISRSCERYRKSERDYHSGLTKSIFIMNGFAVLLSVLKLVDALLHVNIQTIFTSPEDVTMPVISTSPLPWFGVVILAVAVIYVGYSFYLCQALKEECDMKYLNNI